MGSAVRATGCVHRVLDARIASRMRALRPETETSTRIHIFRRFKGRRVVYASFTRLQRAHAGRKHSFAEYGPEKLDSSTRLRSVVPNSWIRVLVYGVWCRMVGFEYSFTERGDKQLDSSTRLLDGVRGNWIRVLVCPLASYPLVSPRSRGVEALVTCSGTRLQPQP